MKTYFSRNKGVTLIEITIVMAIIGIISLATALIFRESHESSAQAAQTHDALSNSIWETVFISKDFRSASRTSLGSYILNGDFEKAHDDTTPAYWAATTGGDGYHTYNQTQASSTVKSGFRSITLNLTNPNSTVTFDTSGFIDTTPNVNYMLTGWVRCVSSDTVGTISVIDSTFAVQASTETNATEWFHITKFCPALNNIGIRLTVSQTGNINGPVHFDDIALTPLRIIMVSTNTIFGAPIAINMVAAPTDPAEPVGFRFSRWENQLLTLFRYRIGTSNGQNIIIREKFDETNSRWTATGPHNMGQGIEMLEFYYSTTNLPPPEGKDSLIFVKSLLRSKYDRRKNIARETDIVPIYPAAP